MMAPETRTEIVSAGSYIYVGLSQCQAYDTVWVMQCYHSQGFSHNADKCNMKNKSPNS